MAVIPGALTWVAYKTEVWIEFPRLFPVVATPM